MTPLQFDLPKEQSSIIKVIGVGGGGSNAVNHMFEQGIVGVNFMICNTDSQALDISRVPNKIQLGPKLTQGLGAGSLPEVGMQATEESIEELREILGKNTKMVFITAGMGGGTGTGGAPVVAKLAKEMGILTVGIVTTPFSFEGKRKYNQALEGIERLKENVDTIIVISNDKIREIYGNARQSEAFNNANNILSTAAKSISEIITIPGFINVDFADVRHTMLNGGTAVMGYAVAEGEGRALKAVHGALNSPLLNDNDIRGAKKILLNITSGTEQVTIDEITEINEYIQDIAKETDIIFGTCDDLGLGDKLSVTVIATGFDANLKPAFNKVTNKTVYELNDTDTPKLVKPVVEKPSAPVIEQPKLFEVSEPLDKAKKDEDFILKNVDKKQIVEEDIDLFSTIVPSEEKATVYEFDLEKIYEEEENLDNEFFAETNTLAEDDDELNFTVVDKTIENVEEEPMTKFTVKQYDNSNAEFMKKEMDNELADRKKILAQLSMRSLNKQNINELENTPAYLRKGVDIDNKLISTEKNYSQYTISQDNINQRPEIRKNNSFLEDNVD